jgi:glycerol-3-phosphate acyltransferase PlsY
MTTMLATSVLSYLAGGIPFSYLAGRLLQGIDLREHGSGNLGASNTFRILGGRVAVVVLVLDVAKGFIPVYVAGTLEPLSFLGPLGLPIAAMFFAILGHLYSPYLKFSGGKGIATSAGAFVALAPWAFLGSFVAFAAVFAARRIVSLASLSGAITLPVFVYLSGRLGLGRWHWSLEAVSVAIMLIVVIKHRSNIARLRAGTEGALARRKGTT